MHSNKLNNKKFNEFIALSSALLLTVSNTFSFTLAKENTTDNTKRSVITGQLAEPYIPPNAKLSKSGKPILDENGNYILLDEEGKIIPSDVLDLYKIAPNKEGTIVYNIQSKLPFKQTRSTNKVVNINSKNINVRKSPNASSAIIGKLPPNKAANLLEDHGNWLKINYQGLIGYISKDFILTIDDSPQSLVKNITNSNVMVRSTNSTSGSVLAKIPAGDTAIAIDYKGGWYKVLYEDVVGWSSGEFIKYVNTPTSQTASITASELNKSTYVKDVTSGSLSYTSNYMNDSYGRHFYCLDPERDNPNGQPYYRVKSFDDVTYRILKNGYPHKSFTGDANTDRIITQFALWSHVDNSRININNIQAIRNNVVDNTMLTHIKNLYNNSKSGTSTQTVSVQFSNTHLTTTFKDDAFTTDYISMTASDSDVKSAKTTLKFIDVATGQERTDVKAVDENGKAVSTVELGQKFRLVIPKTSTQGKIKILGNSNIVHDMAISYSTHLAGTQDSITLEEVNENKDATNDVIVEWSGAGSFTLTKVDYGTNAKLQGAEYSVTNSAGTTVTTLVTDENGVATSPNLPFDTYKVQEIKAPTGYVIDPTVHTVTLNSTTPIDVTFTNKQLKGAIEVIKVDANDNSNVLQGAEFTLFDSNGTAIKSEVTDERGIAKFTDLTYGSYSIKETKAPAGYVLNNKSFPVEINEHGKTITITAENSKIKGSVQITKVDAQDNKKVLKGAEFTLFDLNGTAIETEVTDQNGIADFSNIEFGSYIIRETKAPNGYLLTTQPFNVEITKEGQTISFEVTNTKKVGEVDFSKTDVTTSEIIEGATIEIRGLDETNENINFSFVSSKEGNRFKLPVGKYEFKETIAPEGYVLSSEVGNFEIKEDGEVVKANLTNTPIVGNIEILKVDFNDENKLLAGAEFTLYDAIGKELATETTDENGIAKFSNILYGKYVLKETKAPEGYVLPDFTQEVEIKEHNKTLSFTIKNTKKIGEVDFSKTDVTTSEVIEGATIEIKGLDKENEYINFSFVSSKEGNRFKLPVGKYEFKETIAPEGYVLSSEVGNFEIKEDGEVVKATLSNRPMMSNLKVYKIDIEKRFHLAGAEFSLTDKNGNEIKKVTTDEEGVALFKDIKLGKYTLTETKAPEGYILNDSSIEIEVTKDSEVIELYVENTKIPEASVEILKVDANNKDKTLGGAKFELYDANKKVVASGTTNKQGILILPKLPLGKYTLRETVAPNFYQLSDKTFDIELKEDGEVFKITVENTAKLAQTGGSFTISNLIFVGSGLLAVSFILFRKEKGGVN